jgi:hypothetical protein
MTWSTDPFGNVSPFVRLTADVARSVAFCRVHPALRRDAAEVDGDCARRDLANGPYDVAVVVLREPVPPEWATHAAALGIRRNFHRVLGHDEVPVVGERVAHVGYGLNVTRDDWRSVPGHVTSIGTRRAVDRAIVGIDARPDFAVVATGIEVGGSGSSGGDSGGPLLWLDAAPHPLWGQPPVALHSEAPEGEAGQRGTYLGTPETRGFLARALDRNGDGRFDTWCPPNPFDATPDVYEDGDGWLHGFDPTATPENDRDADGYLDDEDDAPDHYNPCQEDRDDDGVWDRRDNCPAHANADQADRDADGIGDACDRCPDAFATGLDSDLGPGVDLDSSDAQPDGVPDECDVCPFVYDPDQSNCNLDAELVVRAREAAVGVPEAERTPIRGDACHPTPCGETTVGLTLTSFAGSTSTLRHDSIRVDAVAEWEDVAAARSRVVDAREGLRFCRCPVAFRLGDSLLARQECALEVASDIDPRVRLGNCTIATPDPYDAEREDLTAWRWMTIPREGVVARTREPGLPLPSGLRAELPARHEVRAPEALHETDLRIDWRSEDEWARWAGVYPDDPDPRGSAGLDGVLWTHTARRFGGASATWSRELSSHYWSGRIPLPYEAGRRFPPPCAGPVVSLAFSSRACAFCAGMASVPYAMMDFRICRPDDPRFRVDVGNFLLDPDELPPIHPFSSASLAPLRGWAGRWVGPAEPPWQLPDGGLRYLAIEPDLGAIGRVVVETDEGLRDVRSQCPVPGQCGEALAVRSAITLAAGTGPAPRTDWIGIVSATRGELFVAGGRDEAGALLREVWALDPQSGRWRRLEASSSVGRPRAITYDATSDDLLVLDEVDAPRRASRMRLVRLAAEGGTADVVASWPRLTRHDRYALAMGHDGALYVAASGAPAAHVVLRLSPRRFGTFAPAGLAAGLGRLFPDQLRVGSASVSLVVEAGRSYRVAAYEERDFARVPRPEERCF